MINGHGIKQDHNMAQSEVFESTLSITKDLLLSGISCDIFNQWQCNYTAYAFPVSMLTWRVKKWPL